MTTMTISKDVLDELLNGVENADDLLGDQGLMKELKVRLMERMLGAELTDHLGYEPAAEPSNQQNIRLRWSPLTDCLVQGIQDKSCCHGG
jgi:hypothetical protein